MNLYGMEIIVSKDALGPARWIFPKDRFIEWEPKDERSCRALGIGHEYREPLCYQIEMPSDDFFEIKRGIKRKVMFIHPILLEKLKKEMATRNDLPLVRPPQAILHGGF